MNSTDQTHHSTPTRKATYTAVITCEGMPPVESKLHTIRIYEPTFQALKALKNSNMSWDNFLRTAFGMPLISVVSDKSIIAGEE